MTVQKIKSGRIATVTADEYVGSAGTIFFEESVGDLRLGDGATPGGTLLYRPQKKTVSLAGKIMTVPVTDLIVTTYYVVDARGDRKSVV